MPEMPEWKHLGEPEPKGFQAGDIVKYVSGRHRFDKYSNPEWGRGGVFIVGVIKHLALDESGYHDVSWRGAGGNSYQDRDLDFATPEDIVMAEDYQRAQRARHTQSTQFTWTTGTSTTYTW